LVWGVLAGVVGACVTLTPPGSPQGRTTFATWGWHQVHATSQVGGPVLGELPPPGAQRGPPRVLGAWPIRATDQHERSLSCRLRHQLLQAAERGLRPQGTRRGVVPPLGKRVVLPRPVCREAVVLRRRKDIPDGRDAQAAACLRHQLRDSRVIFLPPLRGRWAWDGLHVPQERMEAPLPVAVGVTRGNLSVGVFLALGKLRGWRAFPVASPPPHLRPSSARPWGRIQ